VTHPVIRRVATLDLRLAPWSWPFAEERRADVEAHFAMRQTRETEALERPRSLGRDPVFNGSGFSARYFETDFASFLAWRDWGFPDKSVFNGFGMGALRSSDGAFRIGRNGPAYGECRAHLLSLGYARSRRHQGRRGRYGGQRPPVKSRRRNRPDIRRLPGRCVVGIASSPARPSPPSKY